MYPPEKELARIKELAITLDRDEASRSALKELGQLIEACNSGCCGCGWGPLVSDILDRSDSVDE